MKERIRKLMLKADRETVYHTDDGSPYLVREFDVEKFAELIVKECIKVIETNHPEFDCKESADNLIRRAGRMDAIDEISKHFEVEL